MATLTRYVSMAKEGPLWHKPALAWFEHRWQQVCKVLYIHISHIYIYICDTYMNMTYINIDINKY